LRLGEHWIDIGHRRLERELASFNQPQPTVVISFTIGDTENRVARHHPPLVNAPAAKNPFIDDTGFGCRHGDHARHILGADGGAQDGIDVRSVPAAVSAASSAHAGATRLKASALVAASVAVFFKTSRRVADARRSSRARSEPFERHLPKEVLGPMNHSVEGTHG
jgi:hypothetical protein